MELSAKLDILAGSARYDASCSSSGGPPRGTGARTPAGVCHSWSADGRCITLLKVLLTNVCIYDCAYCINRSSSSIVRTAFTPEQLIELTMEFYRRNYIEGLFLSSGVAGGPDQTMERMLHVVRRLRLDEAFHGYIHMKIIPGCSPLLVREAGFYADRLSANIELASEGSLRRLAPEKQSGSIFSAMRTVRDGMRGELDPPRSLTSGPATNSLIRRGSPGLRAIPAYVPAGQSTQLVVGAGPDRDKRILELAADLYRHYRLKRVYYSAFIPVAPDPRLPAAIAPPLARESRMYQADWLLRFYGFDVHELVNETRPDLDLELDPKTAWALDHREVFPVEINRASREELLRVPGIGLLGAQRILRARSQADIGPDGLRACGVHMKRAAHFVTCRGRRLADVDLSTPDLRRRLLQADGRTSRSGAHGQLSLFD